MTPRSPAWSRGRGAGWSTPGGLCRPGGGPTAAGVFADEVHNWVPARTKLHITPPPGQVLPAGTPPGVWSHTVFHCPGNTARGCGLPTVPAQPALGTAKVAAAGEDTATSAQGLQEVVVKSALGVKEHPPRQVITSFSGLQPTRTRDTASGRGAPGHHPPARA